MLKCGLKTKDIIEVIDYELGIVATSEMIRIRETGLYTSIPRCNGLPTDLEKSKKYLLRFYGNDDYLQVWGKVTNTKAYIDDRAVVTFQIIGTPVPVKTREADRLLCNETIEFFIEGKEEEDRMALGVIKNISEGGFRLLTDEELKEKDSINVIIKNENRISTLVRARVVNEFRKNFDRLYGMQFYEMKPKQLEIVQEYIRTLAFMNRHRK